MTSGLAGTQEGVSAARPAMAPGAVAFAGLAALAVGVGIGRFAFTPIVPMMQADTGLSVSAAGWLAALNYAGYFTGAVAAIWLRVRAATAIRSGLLVIGVATLGMAFAPGFASWALLRTLAGIASAAVLVFVSAWCLERLGPAASPLLTSTVFAGVGTGIAVAGGVCLVVMHQRGSFARAWLVLGVLSLVVAAVIWPAFHGGPQVTSETRGSERGVPVFDAEAKRLILCYGAWGFGYIIPATFLPAMARQAVPDPAVFGWSWPIFGAASVVATFAAAVGSTFRDARRLWTVSQITMAVGAVLPVMSPGMPALVIAALLVGGTFMVNTMAGMREAQRVGGPAAKPLMAAMTAAFALGQIAGPVMVSALAGVGGGVDQGLIVAGAVLLASAYALGRTPGSAVTVEGGRP